MSGHPDFGAELRRLRQAAGISLTQFAPRVHFSKGHLSKVESGQKPPSADLARICDAELATGGRLVRLLRERARNPTEPAVIDLPVDGRETWLLAVSPDGAGYFLPTEQPAAVRPELTHGMAFGLGRGQVDTTGLVNVFLARFTEIRQLGQIAGPAVVLPLVITETQVLRGLAGSAPPEQRAAVWRLAARYAEFAGWMTQEAGDDTMAARWTQWAVRMAELAGDEDLRWYAMVRRADIALHNDDARSTVELAVRAQADQRAPARVRGLAAQREAQGYALAGDEDACLRALERAAVLLDEAAGTERLAGPELGSTNVPDFGEIVLGWCLYELGQPDRAAQILDRNLAGFAPRSSRARTRFALRAALAYAAADELDRAVELVTGLIGDLRAVDSATIRHDLRGLAKVLGRRRGHHGVRALQPLLTAALHAPVGLPDEV
jgi:transcriptional regulator with XRE-family HTH domain/tetratricopeptide (TPR) repeat protein